jgi:hypothetical protein
MDITSCLYNKNKYTCSEIICGFHCFHAVLANTVAYFATVVSYTNKMLKTLAQGLKIFIYPFLQKYALAAVILTRL